MKKCAKCLKEINLSFFNECSTHKDGYQSFCKSCQFEYHQGYYPDKRADFIDRTKDWRKANPVYKKRESYRKAIIRAITNGGDLISSVTKKSNQYIIDCLGVDPKLFKVSWNLCFREAGELVKKNGVNIDEYIKRIKILHLD